MFDSHFGWMVLIAATLILSCSPEPVEQVTHSAQPLRLFAQQEKEHLRKGSAIRWVVRSRSPSELTETVRVPPQAKLLVGYSLQAIKGAPPATMEVGVSIRAAGQEESLLAVQVETSLGVDVLQEHVLDLGAFSSRTVELVFSVRATSASGKLLVTSGRAPRVFWQVPMLYSDRSADERPNVILIALDTLRSDHLNSYGYERDTSPQMAAFAKRGVLFEQAFSQAPWTLPSFASIFTGLHPARHGVVRNGTALTADGPSLPGLLRGAGYFTVGFHDGGYMGHVQGFHNNFDHYERIEGLRSIETVVDWATSHRDLPFFLFLHTYDVHSPYGSVPEEYRDIYSREDRASRHDLATHKPVDIVRKHKPGVFEARDFEAMHDLYDGEIRFVDDQLGRLFAVLDELGLSKRTHVILMSDHGEEFGEHKGIEHHNGNIYRELTQIPLVWVGPGIAQNRRVTELVASVDILPTVLDRLGIDLRTAGDINGIPLVPLLIEEQSPDRWRRRHVFSQSHSNGGARSLRTVEWTLVHSARAGWKLFDRRSDPAESEDVFDQHPDIVKRLRPTLDAFATAEPRAATSESSVLDEETLQDLKALGYIK